MTEKQRNRFYFPAWRATVRACQWTEHAGYLHPNWTACADWRNHHREVIALAQEAAAADSRAVTARDLRHACHRFVFGKPRPTANLKNWEVQRIACFFRLLTLRDQADDLTIMRKWADEAGAYRDSLIRMIKMRGLGGYAAAASRRMYGRDRWEGLDFPALRAVLAVCSKAKSRSPFGNSVL